MKVKDVMTKDVIIVSPEHTLHEILYIFSNKKTSGVPVVENEKLVGLVTEYDVIKALDIYTPKIHFTSMPHFLFVLASLKSKKGGELEREIKATAKLKVKDFMNTELIIIEKDATVIEAARLINKNRINRLPVVENEKVIGMITRDDIIKVLTRLDAK